MVERREKMRQRFARLGLFVFIACLFVDKRYELRQTLAMKQSVDLLAHPEREFVAPLSRDAKGI